MFPLVIPGTTAPNVVVLTMSSLFVRSSFDDASVNDRPAAVTTAGAPANAEAPTLTDPLVATLTAPTERANAPVPVLPGKFTVPETLSAVVGVSEPFALSVAPPLTLTLLLASEAADATVSVPPVTLVLPV